MQPLDWGIVAAFALYAIGSGLHARRLASRSLEEYFLAGRQLRGWQAGLSMAATQFAADTPLLVTGLIATGGIFALWRLWIYALAFLLLGFLLAPCWRRARVLTDAEFAELRYSAGPAAGLRLLKAFYFGTVFNCAVLAMVLFAVVEVAEPLLHWERWLPAPLFDAVRSAVLAVGVPLAREAGSGDVWTRSASNLVSILAIVGVTSAYSATGGLRAVVRTDVVQLGLMLAGTTAYAFWVVDAAGGLGAITDGVHALYAGGGPGDLDDGQVLAFTPGEARDAGGLVLTVFALQWLVQMNADGTGYLAQRSMACRSDRDATQAAVIFTFTQVVLRSLLWIPIGLGLLVLFPAAPGAGGAGFAAEREATFVRGMVELLPTGWLGLMVAAMLAALASTIDTHLNWGASYWTHDIYARFLCRGWLGREPGDRELVAVARASNIGVLVIALAVMTQLGSIQFAWQLSLLLGAGMGVLLVLRWFWWRINAWGEIAAIGASLLLAPVLLLALPADADAARLLYMAAGSTAAGVGASLLTRAESPERLRAFYARVRPPGFWGPYGGIDARARLWRGLAATGTAALCAFALLTGLGSWLAGSPAPVWTPGRAVWIGGLLLLSAGLLPVWWRLGFGGLRPGRGKP
ncbi:MAG: sodium transporter [Deltaproteobacteria bacterium]|nr:sodium transporter [Deltaproteobacteria bacterium]MBW2413664.1 sodium transporter [Deltaproteobacteria bacterium]